MPANVESLSRQDLRDSDRSVHEPGGGAAGRERAYAAREDAEPIICARRTFAIAADYSLSLCLHLT